MNLERIGKLIAELRKEKGMTQSELGNILGVTKNAVSKWERGLCLMDMTLLVPLCDALNISIVELLNGEKIEKENEFKEKSEIAINNTINYSQSKIKKEKYKTLIISSILTIFLILIILTINKLLLLKEFTLEKPKNVENVIAGLKNSESIKIYKKTIPEDQYLNEFNVKIRDDFRDYTQEKTEGEYAFTKYLSNEDNSSFYYIKLPQYVDMFTSNNLTFFSDESKNDNFKGKFDSADRKYFLLKNDINDDLDFIEYVKEHYYIRNSLLMKKRTIIENYSFNLFVSITMPEVKSITLISGDYKGYILNGNNIRELHILRDNNNYMFVLQGDKYMNNDYITDLFSTLEIR